MVAPSYSGTLILTIVLIGARHHRSLFNLRRDGDEGDDVDEETRKEASREWGEKYGREGEKITNPDGVSREFKEGFRRGSMGFGGSNVMPRNFGRTGEPPADWTCNLCHSLNKGSVRFLRGGRLICGMCSQEKELSDKVGEDVSN